MSTETLSYGQHGIRFWPEAGRAFVKRLRLPRPIMMASANASLKARIDELEAQLAKAEASAVTYRDDFERERQRCDRLTLELMRANIENTNAKEAAATAKEAAARLQAELMALRSRPWWSLLMRGTGEESRAGSPGALWGRSVRALSQWIRERGLAKKLAPAMLARKRG